MKLSVENKILRKINRMPRGTLFFTGEVLSGERPVAGRKALQRLVEADKIQRLATGIYYRPIIDDVIGEVVPDIEQVAHAIAKRDKARIVPTGSYALYKLGLTTQVPLNIVYYTDASARKIQIGKQSITFKKASAKNLAFKGYRSMLAVQAMRAIGKDEITTKDVEHIKSVIAQENPTNLKFDLQLAPAWIQTILKNSSSA